MANPQPTDAHLRVAHSINEAIMLRDFTKRQRKILDLILRLSWGCGKKTAVIPRQRDFEIIGIAESHISTELSWLATSQVITIEGYEYSFNKDFDQWQVSRVKPYTPEKLTELVKLNLNGTKPKLTKTVSENLPKEEVSTYLNSKYGKANVAMPKEKGEGEGRCLPPIKEILKKELLDTDLRNNNDFLIEATKLGYGLNVNIPSKEEAEYTLKNKKPLKANRERLEKLMALYDKYHVKEKQGT